MASARRQTDERGRSAQRMRDIPARGWGDILLGVKDKLAEDNISIVAAGVAFFALLAIFPVIAALVSIYGLIADPADVERQMQAVSSVLPSQAAGILEQQLHKVAAAAETSLGLGVILGILVALWSASSGTKTMLAALNITYDEKEKRGLVKLNAVSLLITFSAILFAILAVGAVVVLPAVLGLLGLGQAAETAISMLRWPLMVLVVMLFIAVLYRYGPSRTRPRWRWVSWGAAVATLLWLIGSMLFSWYVSNFANYNETYGSLGAVVILLMWFYISVYVILLGAEMNAETEHTTSPDTTGGER